MSIKTYKPTTPSRRHMSVSGFDGVDKHAKPQKELVEVLKKHSGRNSYGRITVRHQGGGNRKKYRVIDFKRDKMDVPATVLRLEYDPNRSAYIALVEYTDGERRYILAPVGLNVGDTVLSSAAADIKPGNALPLANIPVGTVIHNIELYPGKGAQLVRSAGVAAQLMAKENGMELDAAQAEEMYARLHPVTQELSDDELDNVTGGDSCDVGYSCPKCGSTEASSREPLYGCTYVTCACCGATYWDPTSTKTQN